MAIRQYIGARYVPRFLGTYNPSQNYEALDVVDNGMGTSYVAKNPTSAGTPLTDTSHWAIYGTANGAVINLQNQIDALNAKLSSLIFNVKDYGAVGDGVTDDTQAFKDAIDALPLHGTLYIPMGEYILSDKLSINKPVRLLGSYTGWDVFNSTADITVDEFKESLLVFSNNDFAIEVKTLGFIMENITIEKTNGSHGVYLDNSTSLIETFDRFNIIRNCTIYSSSNNTGNYGLMINKCGLSLFECVHVEGFNVGYAILGTINTSLTFINCWAANYVTTGWSIRNLKYSSFINCAADTIETSANGYVITACEGLEFVACGAEKNIGGFYVDSCKGISISGMVAILTTRGTYGVVVRNASEVHIHDFTLGYPGGTRPNDFYPVSIQGTGSKVIIINTNIDLISNGGTPYTCTSGGFFESNVAMGSFPML